MKLPIPFTSGLSLQRATLTMSWRGHTIKTPVFYLGHPVPSNAIATAAFSKERLAVETLKGITTLIDQPHTTYGITHERIQEKYEHQLRLESRRDPKVGRERQQGAFRRLLSRVTNLRKG